MGGWRGEMASSVTLGFSMHACEWTVVVLRVFVWELCVVCLAACGPFLGGLRAGFVVRVYMGMCVPWSVCIKLVGVLLVYLDDVLMVYPGGRW